MAVHASAVASPPPTSTPVKTWRRDHRPTRGSRGSARCGRRMPATGGRLKKATARTPQNQKTCAGPRIRCTLRGCGSSFFPSSIQCGGVHLVFSRGECPYDFPFTVYKLDWQFARFRKIGPVPPCLPRGPFAADDKRAREDSLTWRGDFFSRWLKRENAISKEHSLREFPRCFQPSDEKSNVGQRKESPVARRIIRPAPSRRSWSRGSPKGP